jgi:putative transposase
MPYTTNTKLPKLRMEAVKKIKLDGWTVRQTARYYGYTPGAVSKWTKKVPKDLRAKAIPTLSSSAHRRPNALSEEKVRAIIKARLKNNRCAEVVHKELKNENIDVSLSSVKRTLKRTNLIKSRSPWKKWHYSIPRPEVHKQGDLMQLDTIHLMRNNGTRFYIYTIVDVYSRWAHAKVVDRISAKSSIYFLKEARKNASFKLETIQTDHGPEFSKYFTQWLGRQKIKHRYSRIRKPNDNSYVERFNRTIQEECFGIEKPVSYTRYLSLINDYLKYYNNTRLHLGLDLKTPSQMIV